VNPPRADSAVLVDRRTLLQAALTTLAAAPAIALLASCGDDSDNRAASDEQGGGDPGAARTAEELRPAVSPDEAIVALGGRYRELRPSEDDIDALQASLGLTDEQLAGANADQWLAAAFADAVRTDFAEGQVDVIDGWILSKTELRAAALLSLLS